MKAIHNRKWCLYMNYLVVINHKTTKFESNSQHCLAVLSNIGGCHQSQNYKIWKQFTTNHTIVFGMNALLSITKLQNLKAIHNNLAAWRARNVVVINHKTTKFESNSQQSSTETACISSCYQSQNYKIWKQFTTIFDRNGLYFQLLSITKLQNLKAIHNERNDTKVPIVVVINHKTTKFESNSQLPFRTNCLSSSCYQSQNYKIWKQFTTSCSLRSRPRQLLSITKLQNLKAIHNIFSWHFYHSTVVINHKTTKFESNSQRACVWVIIPPCYYQSQNYKIWKQFTTENARKRGARRLLSITKLQNLKAIHNFIHYFTKGTGVVINHKTIKFESNSQHGLKESMRRHSCYTKFESNSQLKM